MSSRKSRKIPIIIAVIIVGIVVYLFTNIKQTEIKCEKKTTFDSNIYLKEEITSTMGNQRINGLFVKKVIVLPDKYIIDDTYLNYVHDELDRTLEYLGDKVRYRIDDDRVTVEITVNKNEVVLLDNIKFNTTDDLKMIINSNTKSSEVVALKIGDNYNDGEFMKRLKKDGYSCK